MLDHVVEKLNEEFLKAQRRTTGPKKDPAASLIAERERLNLMYQKGRISEDYYDEQYAALTEKINQFQSTSIITPESYAQIRHIFSGNWRDMYTNLDNAHKQAFWKGIIKEIHCDKDTHKICDFIFLI